VHLRSAHDQLARPESSTLTCSASVENSRIAPTTQKQIPAAWRFARYRLAAPVLVSGAGGADSFVNLFAEDVDVLHAEFAAKAYKSRSNQLIRRGACGRCMSKTPMATVSIYGNNTNRSANAALVSMSASNAAAALAGTC
jgi:hypothetical protein